MVADGLVAPAGNMAVHEPIVLQQLELAEAGKGLLCLSFPKAGTLPRLARLARPGRDGCVSHSSLRRVRSTHQRRKVEAPSFFWSMGTGRMAWPRQKPIAFFCSRSTALISA